jgi:hypothetical protein
VNPGLDWSSKSPPAVARPPKETKTATRTRALQERHAQAMEAKTFGLCKECSTKIRWATTTNGVPIPLDREPSPMGNVILAGTAAHKIPAAQLPVEDEDAFTCHLDTCTRKRSAAASAPRREPTFTCRVCEPNVVDQGGQREFYAHYEREHATA